MISLLRMDVPPMPLNVEERREKNRANAKKSTGPKTQAGKARSRFNSTVHGLRAEILALPTEDPVQVAARTAVWNDFYKPQSPGAQHLLNTCVRATVMADRLALYHDSVVSAQVRAAERDWLYAQVDQLEEHKALMTEDPARAVRMLRRSVSGCDYLVGRWTVLVEQFRKHGFWFAQEAEELVRLAGFDPSPESIRIHPDAFKILFFNSLCVTDDPKQTASNWLVERLCPDSLWKTFHADGLPEQLDCQEWLFTYAMEKIHIFTAIGKEIQTTIEGPDRAEAVNRALVIADQNESRLFLRYSSESRNMFQRAFGSLLKTLEADATRTIEDEPSTENVSSPIEAISEVAIEGREPEQSAQGTGGPSAEESEPEEFPIEAKVESSETADDVVFSDCEDSAASVSAIGGLRADALIARAG